MHDIQEITLDDLTNRKKLNQMKIVERKKSFTQRISFKLNLKKEKKLNINIKLKRKYDSTIR